MPAFKGYRGFPGSICASPNAMVVHGIPGHVPARARRHPLGRRRRRARRLGRRRGAHVPGRRRSRRSRRSCSTRPRASLFAAVPQCAAGNRLGDVSHAIQQHVEARGLLGRPLARRPRRSGATCTRTRRSPTTARPGAGPLLEEGMVLAIEPMVDGRRATRCGWATTTGRSSPRTARSAAHFEFTVAITADGPRVLTPWHEHGKRARPRRSSAGALAPREPLLLFRRRARSRSAPSLREQSSTW